MPALRFTDPYQERHTTMWGRPGTRADLAERLTPGLLDLNHLHDRYLSPEADLAPLIAAVRTATPSQVEDARHLMVHALDMMRHALRSRSFSLPLRIHGPGEYSLRARTPQALVADVAGTARADAATAFEALKDRPRDVASAERLVEALRVAAEAAITLRKVAAEVGDAELRAAADAIGSEADADAASLQTFRNDLGRTYAATAAVIPDADAILADARARAARAGTTHMLDDASTRGLIDELGGSSEDNPIRWGLAGRGLVHRHVPGFSDPEPAPLSEAEATSLRDRFADVLEAYGDLNHRPGFGGHLGQVICALEADTGHSAHLGPLIGLRDLLDRVDARLAPEGRTMLFRCHAQTCQPTRDGRPRELLIGRFEDASLEDPVIVAYMVQPDARDGRALVTVILDGELAEAEASDFELTGEGHWRVGGVEVTSASNFHGGGAVLEHLRRGPLREFGRLAEHADVHARFDGAEHEPAMRAPSP